MAPVPGSYEQVNRGKSWAWFFVGVAARRFTSPRRSARCVVHRRRYLPPDEAPSSSWAWRSSGGWSSGLAPCFWPVRSPAYSSAGRPRGGCTGGPDVEWPAVSDIAVRVHRADGVGQAARHEEAAVDAAAERLAASGEVRSSGQRPAGPPDADARARCRWPGMKGAPWRWKVGSPRARWSMPGTWGA